MSDHQRITDRLREYWESLCQGNDMPSEDQIDSEEISDIWDSCYLVVKENGKYHYSFLGESIIEAYGDNLEGEEVVENEIYPESPGVINKFQEIEEAKEPLLFEGVFINKNNMDIKFRKILLPLGKDGNVEYILGGMRWKAF
ncbi:MAG: hypothetical protein COV36_00360 [Alphaproteobacteria bacterium CG11_big_fil_rev_8_21_14_0_20_44_7]|nr:MAG: hypothetical protein COV36_00360 [Alphaproteobacteria bacterium CG11_big_fil_rev_8_21_14_0_20_44_7]